MNIPSPVSGLSDGTHFLSERMAHPALLPFPGLSLGSYSPIRTKPYGRDLAPLDPIASVVELDKRTPPRPSSFAG